MATNSVRLEQYVAAIRQSGLSIYDSIEIGHPQLWIPTPALEEILNRALKAISLAGLPLRTRSKVVKEYICRALGYPVPPRFKRTRPRFPGQRFDTYVQKSDNLQVWNEELAPTRRYVIVRVGPGDVITRVKVATGTTLARLDTTGRLTRKYQARLIPGTQNAELVTAEDTELLQFIVQPGVDPGSGAGPTDQPQAGQLLPIGEIFERLKSLVGEGFIDAGSDQERNRGAALHRLVCQCLGYTDYRDDGQFPDVCHQLLEVKLQTSPTIDLGLVRPDNTQALDIPHIEGRQIRYCDVRYALFSAHSDGKYVTLTHLFLSTGERFFTRFPQFQGKVLNRKLQVPLPTDFFEA